MLRYCHLSSWRQNRDREVSPVPLHVGIEDWVVAEPRVLREELDADARKDEEDYLDGAKFGERRTFCGG